MAIDLEIVLPSLFFVVGGLAVATWKFRKLWVGTAIRRRDPVRLEHAQPGRTRVRGRIVDVDSPGPYSDAVTDHALEAWRVATYATGIGSPHKTAGWEAETQTIESNPFVIDDGTDRLRVDVGRQTWNPADELVRAGPDTPTVWSGFVVGAFDGHFEDFPERRRNPDGGDTQKRTVTLSRGDDVDLYGTVVADDDDDRVLVPPGPFDVAAVSDRPLDQTSLVDGHTWDAVQIVASLLVVVAGCWGVVYGLGVV